MMRPAIRCVADIQPRFPKKYTDGKRWTMPPMRAANDNRPSAAVSDPLRARRELIQRIPDWNGRVVKAWPTGTRLQRSKRLDDLAALHAWHSATAPRRLLGANDNELQEDEEGAAILPSTDTTTEIQPTVNRLAADWSRPSYTVLMNADVERAPAGRPAVAHVAGGGMFMRMGDLRFDGGILSRYRSGDIWLAPSESYVAAKGGASGQTDGSAAILDPVGANPAEDEAIRCLDAVKLREDIGEEQSLVLDWSCTPATSAEIAIAVKGTAPGKYAERVGVKLVDDAIKRLRSFSAVDVPSGFTGIGIQ